MRKQITRAYLIGGIAVMTGMAQQLPIPGADGADGTLSFPNIARTNVIDLSKVSTGAWNGTPATAGNGIYDPDKWAVVFRYSSVTIPPNAVVRFKNHVSRAPVIWL